LFSALFKNFSVCFPLISGVSTNESTDRITNLARFFVMCLTGICNFYPYKTNIGKLSPSDTRGPKFSPVAFVSLAARTKLQPPYYNVKN